MRINKERSVALIIDVQERIFPVIHDHGTLAKNLSILIQGLRIIGVPVVVTEQYVKGLGPTIPELTPYMEGLTRLEKLSFSCCDDPKVMEKMAVMGKEFVIIAGIESHVCVLQTALDLKANGYHPVVVEDCISSRLENNKKIAIERMRQDGAIITSYESLLFELLRYSGTEEFKAVSKLVK